MNFPSFLTTIVDFLYRLSGPSVIDQQLKAATQQNQTFSLLLSMAFERLRS